MMPLYDYKCLECEEIWEVQHGISEAPELSCPACRSSRTQKVISRGVRVVYKGRGFYTTDRGIKGVDSTKEPASKPEVKGE